MPSRSSIDQIMFWMVFVGLLYELAIMPFLILMDLSYSFNIQSNYMARFSYIALFIFAWFYVLIRGSIFLLPHYVAFFLLLCLGLLNGAIQQGVNLTTLSHIFYYLMPVFAMHMGYNFGRFVQSHPIKLNYIFKFLHLSVWLAFVIVMMHLLAVAFGLNSYNKLGLWPLIIAFPLLLAKGNWTLGLVIALLANKYSVIIVALITTAISLFLKLYVVLVFFVIVIISMTLFFTFYQPDIFSDWVFVNHLTSGRWAELQSMLAVASKNATTLFFGSGFGAAFVPWIESPEYVSHYTHLGNFTWLWVTGIFGYAVLSWFLFSLIYKLYKVAIKPDSTIIERYVFLACTAILSLSLMGAILANSTISWIYLGWGYWVVYNRKNKFID